MNGLEKKTDTLIQHFSEGYPAMVAVSTFSPITHQVCSLVSLLRATTWYDYKRYFVRRTTCNEHKSLATMYRQTPDEVSNVICQILEQTIIYIKKPSIVKGFLVCPPIPFSSFLTL